jgi:hypothetical protein
VAWLARGDSTSTQSTTNHSNNNGEAFTIVTDEDDEQQENTFAMDGKKLRLTPISHLAVGTAIKRATTPAPAQQVVGICLIHALMIYGMITYVMIGRLAPGFGRQPPWSLADKCCSHLADKYFNWLINILFG